MFKKLKNWHGSLSKTGKFIVWTALLIGSVGILNAAANPEQPKSATKTDTQNVQTQKTNVTTKTVTETQPIAFTKTTVNDGSLEKGKTTITTVGVDGIKTLTYQITYTDGKQTAKKLLKEEVTKQPIAEVTAVGTKVAASSSCDTNYSGACVPIASDVDCAGGNGNGPAYVRGPVKVIGSDIYGLDRDGNGLGCE